MTCLKVGLSSPAFFVEVYELILMEIIMVTFAEKNNAVFFERLSYNNHRNGSGKGTL